MITSSVIHPITRDEAMMAPANKAAPRTAMTKAPGCILMNRHIKRLPSCRTVHGDKGFSDMTETQRTISSLL